MGRSVRVCAVLVLTCAVGSATALAQAATDGTEPPSPLMLWVATAIGGVGGVLVVQALKRLIDRVLPEPINRKAMYYVSWVVSFGFGIAAYVLFPEGRTLIARQPFAIFQAGSTVSALAAAIYRLAAERLGFSRNVGNVNPVPIMKAP